MNILIFDTETTSLDKPFCYNDGYLIYDTEAQQTILKRDFVVEQIWHNLPLFQTAYYADKRPLYVSAMKGKTTRMEKWGYITQQMCRDIKNYEVSSAYAYNSPFDEKVFNYNSEWFKTINPFDNVPIYDIRGYAHSFICNTPEYEKFCEQEKLFTDAGNYSTTAEAVFRYIEQDPDFEEAHTALADAEIELKILTAAMMKGAELEKDYPVKFSFERKVEKTLSIIKNKEEIASFKYYKMTVSKDKKKITLK